MHEHHFAPGQYVFRQGDPSDVAYILTSGSVEIVAASTSGELRLAVMREGDIFGEMGAIDKAPRSASARALEPVLVMAVPRNEFVQTFLSQEEQGLALLRALFERLRVANQLLLRTVEGTGYPTSPMRTHVPEAAAPSGSSYQLTLVPLTQDTKATLPAEGVRMDRLPVRIGRRAHDLESSVLAFNEVELHDSELSQVSLNHLAIDVERGRLMARDRGSRTGTGVNGERIRWRGAAHDRSARRGRQRDRPRAARLSVPAKCHCRPPTGIGIVYGRTRAKGRSGEGGSCQPHLRLHTFGSA